MAFDRLLGEDGPRAVLTRKSCGIARASWAKIRGDLWGLRLGGQRPWVYGTSAEVEITQFGQRLSDPEPEPPEPQMSLAENPSSANRAVFGSGVGARPTGRAPCSPDSTAKASAATSVISDLKVRVWARARIIMAGHGSKVRSV